MVLIEKECTHNTTKIHKAQLTPGIEERMRI